MLIFIRPNNPGGRLCGGLLLVGRSLAVVGTLLYPSELRGLAEESSAYRTGGAVSGPNVIRLLPRIAATSFAIGSESCRPSPRRGNRRPRASNASDDSL